MEGRRLRERKDVSYDEKKLEAQQYKGDFEFMDTDTEMKQGLKGRCAQCHEVLGYCGRRWSTDKWITALAVAAHTARRLNDVDSIPHTLSFRRRSGDYYAQAKSS